MTWRIVCGVVCGLFLQAMFVGPCAAQANDDILPQGWQDLTPAELVAVINQVRQDNPYLFDLVKETVAERAASLLLGESLPLDGDLPWLGPLVELAGTRLTAEQQASLRQSLAAARGVTATSGFSELSALVSQMKSLGASAPERGGLVKEWLTAHAVQELTTDELGWLAENVGGARVPLEDFRVTWSGSIIAPITGDYRFGISPIDPNLRTTVEFWWGRATSQIASMQVTLGSQLVVDAKEGAWQSKSLPVRLQAGQAVPISVTYSYQSDSYVPFARAPVAQLFWEGAGIGEQLVPGSAFVRSSGAPGLDVTYRNQAANGTLTEASAVHSQVDLLSFSGNSLAPEFRAELTQVAEEIRRRAFAPDALNQFAASGSSDTSSILFELKRTMELLPDAVRQSLAEELSGRPDVVARLPLSQVVGLYYVLRHGSSRNASVEILGHWMQRNSLGRTEFASKYHRVNREFAQSLAHALVRQYPAHYARFREQYLSLPDGGCSVPAACVVAYAELIEGRIENWIATLDAKLSGNLMGDARSRWLVARAQAEEIRKHPIDPLIRVTEKYFAGIDWLEQAQEVAQSDEVRVFVAREIASRQALFEEFSNARTRLAQVETTTESGRAELSQANADLDLFEASVAAGYTARAKNAMQMRIAHFTKRLQYAQSSGSPRAANYARTLAELKAQLAN